MLRGGLVDYNVRGRQVGRPEGSLLNGEKIPPQLNQFIIADPAFSEEYKTSKKHIVSHTPQAIEGIKHFWRSDYTMHHRPAYATSLKMCSERTVGIELNMNSENKLGYWLPYGLTYIYHKGDEYQGIFPAWDWAGLPGVTSPLYEYEEKGKGVAYIQKTTFVGGVSDGKYGLSTMDFSKDNTKAKKSWFWFDEGWAALGTGIASIHDAPIVTGINQCLVRGKVLVYVELLTQGRKSSLNPTWIAHDSIGYIFPGDETVELKAETQHGNIRRIYGLGADSVDAPEVFSLWFHHGLHPSDESYAYIVVPGKSAAFIKEYAQKSPVSNLSNSQQVQAVFHEQIQITGIAFHQAGEFTICTDFTLAVDQLCLVLLDHSNSMMTVSDPTAKLDNLTVLLNHRNGNSQTKSIDLPKGGFAGKSVSIKIELIS